MSKTLFKRGCNHVADMASAVRRALLRLLWASREGHACPDSCWSTIVRLMTGQRWKALKHYEARKVVCRGQKELLVTSMNQLCETCLIQSGAETIKQSLLRKVMAEVFLTFGGSHLGDIIFKTSTVVVCLLSLGLWLLALVSLLVGGHGEVFVCRPLYDEPEFRTLTRLVDEPGVFYRRGGGFFSNMLYGNETMNVPLREVLMECQDNRPTYEAFRLHRVFDVDAASNHRSWDTLHTELANLEVNLTDLRLLTPYLQRQLTSLVTTSAVNLTSYRAQFSGQITGKDLSSFSNQLESVANQIKDLATASRMETLASRTRRLVEDLVYQLTALEVQINPLQRQVNQSLSHLKTIQYFINNQGSSIAHQVYNEI
uniref:Uncharacterized protein n=1 Tax=Timema poppense TaxID=170557 RepID=A0A7R9CVN2_TIMPO|nr:unnamed protein product [Timema poppensis]